MIKAENSLPETWHSPFLPKIANDVFQSRSVHHHTLIHIDKLKSQISCLLVFFAEWLQINFAMEIAPKHSSPQLFQVISIRTSISFWQSMDVKGFGFFLLQSSSSYATCLWLMSTKFNSRCQNILELQMAATILLF